MGNETKSRCSIKTKFPTGPKPSTYVSTEISITSLWTWRKKREFLKMEVDPDGLVSSSSWTLNSKTGFIREFLDTYFKKEIRVVNHLQKVSGKFGWKTKDIAVLFSRPERRKRKLYSVPFFGAPHSTRFRPVRLFSVKWDGFVQWETRFPNRIYQSWILFTICPRREPC